MRAATFHFIPPPSQSLSHNINVKQELYIFSDGRSVTTKLYSDLSNALLAKRFMTHSPSTRPDEKYLQIKDAPKMKGRGTVLQLFMNSTMPATDNKNSETM